MLVSHLLPSYILLICALIADNRLLLLATTISTAPNPSSVVHSKRGMCRHVTILHWVLYDSLLAIILRLHSCWVIYLIVAHILLAIIIDVGYASIVVMLCLFSFFRIAIHKYLLISYVNEWLNYHLLLVLFDARWSRNDIAILVTRRVDVGARRVVKTGLWGITYDNTALPSTRTSVTLGIRWAIIVTLRILWSLGGTCKCTHSIREFTLPFSDNFERLFLVMDVEWALLTVWGCICYSIDGSYYRLIGYSNIVYNIANFTSDRRMLLFCIIDKLM